MADRKPVSKRVRFEVFKRDAVATKAAVAMCISRYGKDGLKITAIQSTGITWPLTIS